jgi:alpha-D-ribose 1-methylphosphonate 5-triphosphate synthase subunit PhnG
MMGAAAMDETVAPSAGADTVVRQRWLAVLAKASLAELEAAWGELADKPRYRILRQSETGLVMVRGRIAGTGQPFNLGEMTMTRAAVQLLAAAGGASHTGFGHVAGRSRRRAELVALFDALLQDSAR